MIAATPLIIAALGVLVCERAGVLNLGVEGMMLIGAVTAFAVGVVERQPVARLSRRDRSPAWRWRCCSRVLTLTLQTNQVATGLALALFGVGLSAFVGQDVRRHADRARSGTAHSVAVATFRCSVRCCFATTSLVYLSHRCCTCGVSLVPVSHRAPACDCAPSAKSPAVAHSLGEPVIRIRYLAVMFGGAMSGIAGAYLSTALTPMWVEGMSAGRGWIVLALVVFATWRPLRVLLGAYLFGGVTVLQLHAQGVGVDGAERVPVDAAVPRDDRGAGADLSRSASRFC